MLKGLKTYLKYTFIGIAAAALPFTLVFGIAVADSRTRSVGYSDAAPAFDYYSADDKDVICLFGKSFTLPGEVRTAVKVEKYWQKIIIPQPVLAGAVFTEKIIDRLART